MYYFASEGTIHRLTNSQSYITFIRFIYITYLFLLTTARIHRFDVLLLQYRGTNIFVSVRIYIYNMFVMLRYDGSVIPNFFANHR